MKKKHILIEFLLVFILLCLPPMLKSMQADTVLKMGMPNLWFGLQILIALALDLQHRREYGTKSCRSKNHAIINAMQWWALTVGMLMLCFAAETLAFTLIYMFFDIQKVSPNMEFTTGALGIVLAAVTFAGSAYYEEVIYRQFLPDSLKDLLGSSKTASYTAYAFSILTFAAAHRYLGPSAVVNAALGGMVLQLCRNRTGSIYTGAAAHWTYNMSLFIFTILN